MRDPTTGARALDHHPFAPAIEYTVWANQVLIDFCCGLPEDRLEARIEGTLGSVRETLVHIGGAQRGYAAKVSGGGRPDPLDDCPGFDALTAENRSSGEALLAVASRPPGPRLPIWNESQTVEPFVVLMQAVHHANEHRAQTLTTLSTFGVAVPEPSAWEWGQATGRISKV